MEDEESLQSGALVSQLANAVQHQINDFFPDSVVTTSIVVCGILLSGDQLFRMEELAVGASADFI